MEIKEQSGYLLKVSLQCDYKKKKYIYIYIHIYIVLIMIVINKYIIL